MKLQVLLSMEIEVDELELRAAVLKLNASRAGDPDEVTQLVLAQDPVLAATTLLAVGISKGVDEHLPSAHVAALWPVVRIAQEPNPKP